MHQLHPYSQSLLDAVQASARAITIAAFLTIGVANYAVFGGDLEVGRGSLQCRAAAGCMQREKQEAACPLLPINRIP